MRRWIFLSPHLDDAVLSCGGLIARLSATTKVEIWTLFSGAPWCGPYSEVARWLHCVSGGVTGRRLALLRQQEDQTACKILGAGFRRFGWYDAVYRKSGWNRFVYPVGCQAKISEQDQPFLKSVSRELQRLITPDDIVFVPLAVGGHVDHQITRAAAEMASHPSMAYYSDVPYLQRYPEQLETATVGLASINYTIHEEFAGKWIDAVHVYKSQIEMLQDAVGSLDILIKNYSAHPLRLFTKSTEVHATLPLLIQNSCSVSLS